MPPVGPRSTLAIRPSRSILSFSSTSSSIEEGSSGNTVRTYVSYLLVERVYSKLVRSTLVVVEAKPKGGVGLFYKLLRTVRVPQEAILKEGFIRVWGCG
jgi:hypothetical protein